MDFFEVGRVVDAFIDQLHERDPHFDLQLSFKLRDAIRDELSQVSFAFTGVDDEDEVVLVAANWSFGTCYSFAGNRLRKQVDAFPHFDLVEEIDLVTGQRFARIEGSWTVSLFGYDGWDSERRVAFWRSWETIVEGERM